MEALKANELRIGNWISNGAMPITAGFDQIRYAEIFQPIPLTKDWLIRFGFEKTSDNEHTKDRFVIRKQQRDLVINGFEYDYNGILLSHPEYVHTLQNIYFALMGEELTLKN